MRNRIAFLGLLAITANGCESNQIAAEAGIGTAANTQGSVGPMGPTGPQGPAGSPPQVSSWFECSKRVSIRIKSVDVFYKVVSFSNGDRFVKCHYNDAGTYYSTIDFLPSGAADTGQCVIRGGCAAWTFTTTGAAKPFNYACPSQSSEIDRYFSFQFDPADCSTH